MKRQGAPLGQHFLTGLWAASSLARAAGITQSDTVLEIGPGKGALTRELLRQGGRVFAIEKDEALVKKLEEKFRDEIAAGQLELYEGDIRDFDPRSLPARRSLGAGGKLGARSYIVAANIPYYITGEIIRKFLTAKFQPKTIALLVQKEVAQRIVGSKESILSLSVKAYGEPRLVKKVPKVNFSPPPSVDSAILVIRNISRNFFTNIDEDSFFEIVRAGFSSKRKLLAGNLAKKFGTRAREALTPCGIPEKSRAEDVPLEKWKCLVEQLRASSV